jgi:hypothetical protein
MDSVQNVTLLAVGGSADDWTVADVWQPLGVLAIVLLVVRLLTLAWLLRSQIGWRSRIVAGPRRGEIREYFSNDASQRQYALRQLQLGYPRHLLASGLELVIGTAVIGGMAVLMSYENSATPASYSDRISLDNFKYHPPFSSTWLVHAFDNDNNGGGVTVLIGLALALLWLGGWYRTRYLLHVVHTPSGTWEQSRLRQWLLPQIAVRFLAVLLLLPVAGMAALLIWQLVSLLAARRFQHRQPLAAPLPVVAGGATGTAQHQVSALWTPAPYAQLPTQQGLRQGLQQPMPQTQPPQQYPQHSGPQSLGQQQPGQQGPGQQGHYANLPQTSMPPGHTPQPAAPPTLPATAVPQPAAVATPPVPATNLSAPLPIPVVRCQPLTAHEPHALGPYQLLGRIGSGGMGTVYVACLEGSATQVALKTLKPELLGDAELSQRFQRESEALARVSSAYTARVIDSGIAEGIPYIAMDLLDGSALDAHLDSRGPIDSPDALRAFALALAAALDGVHRSGLVHRDLKPGNIMLTTAGPRLLDFGIAVMLDRTRLTRTGMGIGTLPYMAPEQFGDEPAGPWTDVWAWGCCLVAATSGRSPFQARDTAGVLNRVLNSGPDEAAMEPLARIAPDLHAVVRLALTRDTAQRPADGNALLDALLAGAERPPDLGAQITRGWRTLHL